jgi:hypothetical protein
MLLTFSQFAEGDVASWQDFTRGIKNPAQPATIGQSSQPPGPRPHASVNPERKRRHLLGEIAGIVHELVHLHALDDTDRRLLKIASALAFLLADR